ncbi:RNA ligase family protein [Brevibacillus agri]|uniref:ATP-dependent DNA ligase n=1 Tax=Bacteria TaxID=2 RepID=UPI002E1C24AB|nr:RNA ligase family protein [Brevibacillus agri]MED1657834.1 RNA ligase family protein [Brevibacillus agri]MED1689769.1 RNA ligase family protein [Brevibacillus agri]MED1695529.1 RNA ligase family protein [Brevibacillus agri]MED1695725.1 RNA ligase family protein [Brevibacillus agri]
MFLEPMLLRQRDEPFDDGRFIYEPKIDGHRLILSKINGKTTLHTRHHNECTAQYPELCDLPIDHDVILDGEVYCIDADGQINFELIMSRFQTKGPDRIAAATKRLPVGLMVFDILHLDGRDLRDLPLMQRKEILDSVIPDMPVVHKIPFLEKEGRALFASIKEQDLEGIVCKRKDSRYVGKRSVDWIKVINYQYADVFISGYRKGEFGWLACVMGTDGRPRPAGIIELGVPPLHKQAFRGVCGQLVTGEDKNFVYLEPRLRATVKFRNWTKSGMLRTPVFVDFVLGKAC